jgi:hypothetical protein
MIRPAKFSDTPAIEALLRNTHKRSRYGEVTSLNEKALNQTVLGLIAGQNQNGPGGTHVTVAEHGGKVLGFMAGQINRVYGVCDHYTTSDVFLVNESHKASDTVAMIDAYLDWAKANPKVLHIGLSWSDAVPGSERLAKLYSRKGFHMVGEQWEMQYEMRMNFPERLVA